MPNPQQPELRRSGKTPAQDPDSAAAVIEGSPTLSDEGGTGPVPPENQPGHHPPTEQDKPDLDAFAERLSAKPDAGAGAGADQPQQPQRGPAGSPRRRAMTAGVGAAATLLVVRALRRRRSAAKAAPRSKSKRRPRRR